VVLRYRRHSQSGYSRFAEAADLAEAFSTLGFGLPTEPGSPTSGDPLVLAYWPAARTNQFQALLYNRSWEYATACVPVQSAADLAEMPWAGPLVCHFHWLASIGADAANRSQIDSEIGEFETLLNRLKQQQRKILWTVHNVLPHDEEDIESAVRIRTLMVDAADILHVMNPHTARLVEPYFSIAHKPVFYSPHPSYLGEYPDTVTRAEARFQLGIRPDVVVFFCFGAILRYKGLEDLLAAAESLKGKAGLERGWKLVIAGDARDEALIERIRSIETLDEELIVHAHKIATDDVQYYFNAADYCVCPYRSSLNSGAAMLALSFGVPLIAPATDTFRELLERSTGIGYDPADPAALATALSAALAMDTTEMRRNAGKLAEERKAETASAVFFGELTSRLGS
jgi:beta-1,4-mannosyltransferase